MYVCMYSSPICLFVPYTINIYKYIHNNLFLITDLTEPESHVLGKLPITHGPLLDFSRSLNSAKIPPFLCFIMFLLYLILLLYSPERMLTIQGLSFKSLTFPLNFLSLRGGGWCGDLGCFFFSFFALRFFLPLGLSNYSSESQQCSFLPSNCVLSILV